MEPWCSGYHYCRTSFKKAWTEFFRRFKSCSWCIGELRCWKSLAAGNKAQRTFISWTFLKAIHIISSYIKKDKYSSFSKKRPLRMSVPRRRKNLNDDLLQMSALSQTWLTELPLMGRIKTTYYIFIFTMSNI